MELKNYSRPLDLLLASVESCRKGKTELAGRFFVRASMHKDIGETLDILDRMNERAANVDKSMSKSIRIAMAKLKEKAEEEKEDSPAEDEKEESTDEELDLEESNGDDEDDSDNDDSEESTDGVEDDLDSILDGIDSEESTNETHQDLPTEDVKEADIADSGEDSPEGPDNLNDETPPVDKNEPASTTARTKKVVKAKRDDKRTQSVARNMKILARLAATHRSSK